MIARTVTGLKAQAANCTMTKGDRIVLAGSSLPGKITKASPGNAAYGYYNVKLDNGRSMIVHFTEMALIPSEG